jgi:hypothetical protein
VKRRERKRLPALVAAPGSEYRGADTSEYTDRY